MKELIFEMVKLATELVQLDEDINRLYAQKRDLTEKMKLLQRHMVDEAGATGKTINDLDDCEMK